MTIEVSPDIGYVAIVVVLALFLHIWMGAKVVAARIKYKVHFPTMYAVESENKEAKLFNCIQRGHQNFLEMVPFFLAELIFAGLQHPKLAAILGFLFLVARVVYFVDYSTGDPKKRMRGLIGGSTCVFALAGCCISFAVHQLVLTRE